MTQPWNHGHSIHGGYPHDAIHSKELIKKRVLSIRNQDDGKIHIIINPAEWDLPMGMTDQQMMDFLSERINDLNAALDVSEGQIEDMLTEGPFIPEEMGFELLHKPATIHDAPVRVYGAKYDTSYSLYRKPALPDVNDFDPSLWVLMKKQPDGQFTSTDLSLPCERIAYAAFSALLVPVRPESAQNEAESAPVIETMATNTIAKEHDE